MASSETGCRQSFSPAAMCSYVLICRCSREGGIFGFAPCHQTNRLTASSLTDPAALNTVQMLETVSLKTAEAFPDGFTIRKKTVWPGLEQRELHLVLPGSTNAGNGVSENSRSFSGRVHHPEENGMARS